jgi:hypothetical protein
MFQFHQIPKEVQDNIYKQFDLGVINSPYFQENVKVDYDDQGRFQKALKEKNSNLLERKVSDALTPFYEDNRKFCAYPLVKPVSDIFTTSETSSSLITLGKTPVLDAEGNFAYFEDLLFFIDGKKSTLPYRSFDALTGIIDLGYDLPSNTPIRIDYWHSERFPTLITQLHENITQKFLDDKKLSWPFITEYLEDKGDYQLAKFPILDRLGNLAKIDDIKVYINDVERVGAIVDSGLRPLRGHIRLNFEPLLGETLKIEYYHSEQDRSYLFIPDDLGYSGDTVYGNRDNCTLLCDTNNFNMKDVPIDQVTSVLEIGYRWRAFDLSSSSVLNSADTLITNGHNNPSDGLASIKNAPFRTNSYNVTFSPEHLTDTSKLITLNDNYLKKVDDSIAITPTIDTYLSPGSNSNSLDIKAHVKIIPRTNGLKANTVLKKGTPLFVNTWNDLGEFSLNEKITPTESTYQIPSSYCDPDSMLCQGTHDLKASVNIISLKDDSGLIEYNSVSKFRSKKRISIYSDPFVVESTNSGKDVSLSSLCENRGLQFDLGYREHYFPDRELRLFNYLDYNLEAPGILLSGTAKTRYGSDIIKSIQVNWTPVKRGDTISFLETGEKYMVMEVLGSDTIRLHSNYSSGTGSYLYRILRDDQVQPEVFLNKVTRRVLVDLTRFYKYYSNVNNTRTESYPNDAGTFNLGATVKIISNLTYESTFPDPSPDPTPITSEEGLDNFPKTASDTIDPASSPLPANYNQDFYPPGSVQRNSSFYPRAASFYRQESIENPRYLIEETIDPNPPEIKAIPPYPISPNADPIPLNPPGISPEESLYRVRWRNWDQTLLAVCTGIVEENLISLPDDYGDGIKIFFWKVSTQTLEEYVFYGSIISTSEILGPGGSELLVAAGTYPDGLIRLENLSEASNPGDNGLTGTMYYLRDLVIRELLQDDTYRIIQVQEFVRVPENPV